MIKIKKIYILGIVQVLIILLAGILVKDVWYKIIISIMGILFNALVSIGKRQGFIVGVCYAILYGLMSYAEGLYASAIFMLLVQVPMGMISFSTWKKQNSDKTVTMDSLSTKARVSWSAMLVFSNIIIFFILKKVNGSGAIFDSFFFATSLISCILLSQKKKEAYFVIMLSGLGGTALWLYQLVTTSDGISVLLLNFFVCINAVKGLYIQSNLKNKLS